MARFPGAVWKPLSRNYSPGARTAQLGLILHVQAGNGELSGWFSNQSAQASSTFWVGKDGTVVQYMEAGTDKSWAQGSGNGLYDSVETEGYPTEPLTDAQVAALAKLVRWEHDTYGMPYTVINTPGAKGFGWHGMGGAAWGGHTGCPGDLRKAQMPQILVLAQGDTTTTTTTTTTAQIQEDLMTHPFIIMRADGADVPANTRRGAALVAPGYYCPVDQEAIDVLQTQFSDGTQVPVRWVTPRVFDVIRAACRQGTTDAISEIAKAVS